MFKKSESSINFMESTSSIRMDRKESSEYDNQEIEISLNFHRINLDIRPYYLEDEKAVIFSNTRSIVSLYNSPSVNIIMNKESNEKYISCHLPSSRFYFLAYEDREP